MLRRLFSPRVLAIVLVSLVPVASLLAKETGEDRPVKSLGGAVHADPFTGVATTSIPIEVPPGRSGMQPSLALTYNSAAGNGWLGMGWDLEQEGIYRQTKWGVDYSKNTDTIGGKAFVVKMAGVSGELVQTPSPAPSTQWSTKVEGGFSKIEKLTALDGQSMWKVTTKQGRKYYLGQTAASRQVDPANAANIFGWLLDRVEDTDGNYMTYSYWTDPNDPTNGQKYLKQIDYAGNTATGASTTNTIRFWLDDGARPDQADMYATNYRIKTKHRLKTVMIQANGSMVRAYELLYDLSPSVSRSRLSSVKAYGKDAGVDANGGITSGTSWPATTFGYSSDTQTFTDGNAWLTGWCSGALSSLSADFNGDGKQDLWCKNSSGTSSIAYSSGAGTFTTGTSPLVYSALPPADFNGDGKRDLWAVNVYWNPNPPPEAPIYEWYVGLSPGFSGNLWDFAYGPVYGATSGDFNGDGKQDILVLTGNIVVHLSNGASFQYTPSFTATMCSSGTSGIGDFNGDGKDDVWCNSGGSITILVSTGSSFVSGPSLTSWCGSGSAGVGDFNGDGKQDFYCHPTDGTTKVALSTGTSFVDSGNWATSWCATGQFGVGDFNGDGMLDVYCHPSDGTTQIALSRGSSFVVNATSWFNSWCTTGTFGVGDFNGDGKADVYCFNAGTLSVARSGASLTQSNLLASVSTGLGGATTLTYDTSANDANNRVPFAVQRVKTLSVCDTWNSATSSCSTTPSTTTYAYQGGYYQIGERDLRGVNYVKVTGPGATSAEQLVTETWFHQGNDLSPPAGTPPDLPESNKAVATGYMKGLPYKVKVTKGNNPNFVYSETTTYYRADTDTQAPWFTPPSEVNTKIENGGKETTVIYTSYDSYGNVTQEQHYGETWGSGDEITLDRAFVFNLTDYVQVPVRETRYAGLGTGGPKLSETIYSYDGSGTGACTAAPTGSNTTVTKGKLTKVERWLNPGGTQVTSGMEYDPQTGVLLCTRDPLGHKTTLTYDASKTFPLTSTNALGHVTTTVYYGVNGVASDTGLYGQAKSVTDPNGKTTTTTYDTLGRKLTTTTPDGLVQTMAYNYGGAYPVSTQHVQSTTSGGGLSANLVSKTYFDGLGRTTKTEQPGAADGGANLKVLVTETQYDIRGLVTQTSLPYIQGSESATGRWRTLTYDAVGRLTKTTNPDGTSSTVCYNAWTTTSIDPKLHKKVQTKDAWGRLVTVQEYTGTGSATDCSGGTLYATTTYRYDLLGNLLGVTDAKGNVSSMTYDTLGRKLTMHDPDMGDWSYTYDANGNLLTQVDAKNQKLCFSYDALNRRTQKNYGTTTVACGTNTVVYAYDDTVAANNGKGRLKQVSDPAQSVTFQYDSRGRISQSAKTLDGTTYTTTSAYDGLGRLTTVNYPTSPIKTVTYTYDGPQLKSVQEGATIYVTYAGWNALGQPATSTFGNGVVTTHTYANTANATCTQQTFRLCTLKTTGPGTGGGAPTLTGSVADRAGLFDLSAHGTTDWKHWSYGHVATAVNRKVGGSGISDLTPIGTETTVDGQGYNLAYGVTWSNGTPTASATTPDYLMRTSTSTAATGYQVTVPADTTLRTVKVAVLAWGGGTAKLEATLSDGSAPVYSDTSVNSVNGTAKKIFTLQYRAALAGQTLTIKWTTLAGSQVGNQVMMQAVTLAPSSGSGPGTSYQDLRYEYEANGNVWNIYDQTIAATAGDQHFVYDELDRLTLANGPYGASGVNATLSYAYDEIGNMTVNPQVGTYIYPASGASSVRPHAVSTAGPYPLTYDQNGNLVTMTDPTGFFGYNGSYNAENRLSSLTTTYGGVPTTATFVYDGDGGRVKKTEGATTTRYISKLYECDNTNCSRFIWAGSTRIATIAINTGTTHYWHGDHLGSSSVITDSTGAKVQALAYYPFGDLRTNQSYTTPVVNVPYKYTGKELDASSNLYFYEARYYHPVFGRFISPDTIVPNPSDPQSLNRYSYVGNNPLKYTDPTGHGWFSRIMNGVSRAFSSPIVRTVSWAILPGVAQYADPVTRKPAIVGGAAVVGFVVGGPVGSKLAGDSVAGLAFWGAVGGAISGGVSGAYDGGLEGAAKGAFSGAMFGAIGGAYGNNWDMSRVALNSVAGGVSSQIKGGGFARGFATSLAVSGLSFSAIEMRSAMIANSMGNPDNLSGESVGFNGDGIKLGGGRMMEGVDLLSQHPSPLGGFQGGHGMIAGIPYAPGSLADRVVETFAGPHDALNSWYWYDSLGNAINHQGVHAMVGEALNYVNVFVAAPFAAASVVPNQGYQYFAK